MHLSHPMSKLRWTKRCATKWLVPNNASDPALFTFPPQVEDTNQQNQTDFARTPSIPNGSPKGRNAFRHGGSNV